MKDKKTFFAFLLLICLVGFLIYLVLQKKSDDNRRDILIHDLTTTVQSLSTKVSELKSVKGIDGKTPEKGVDYTDGKNGKDGKDGIDGRDGMNGKDGAVGMPGLPAPELDISCIENKLMKKYTNDDFWQPTNMKCEVAL